MPSFNVLTATAAELQKRLTAGEMTSVQIVEKYLAQIKAHDDYLHAVLETSSKAREIAEELDKERKQGKIRGPLHGIPILLKDNIATHPSLGLATTAGSYSLVGSVPKASAGIVDQLIKAGVVLLGKANLSEFAGFKGAGMQPGWSALGGQTQSAYVRGGVVPDGSILGHSSPGGSSTGSAVAVSAGYVPISIGTETDGSLITPANRASLYAMRPTVGLVPRDGIVPISATLDTAGPIAKCVEDLANLLDALVLPEKIPKGGYASAMVKSWDGIRVGTLDPEKFFFEADVMKPNANATKQMVKEIRQAYSRIKSFNAHVKENISYVTLEDLEYDGVDILSKLNANDFKKDLEDYLSNLEESKVRTLEDIIQFNTENKEKELPLYSPSQSRMERALNSANRMSADERQEVIRWMRERGGPKGIDYFLQKYEVDVIIGPADCECTEPPAAAGYPVATMPLSSLELNGRPFGLSVVASAHQEELLIKVLSAWEATSPPRVIPSMLQSSLNRKILSYRGLMTWLAMLVLIGLPVMTWRKWQLKRMSYFPEKS